jgi:hypothetical protein
MCQCVYSQLFFQPYVEPTIQSAPCVGLKVTLYASNSLFQQINKILSHDSYKILTNEVALKRLYVEKYI